MRITDNIFFKRDYGAGTFLEIGIATALPCTFSLNDMRALLYGCQISSVRKKDLIVRYVPGTPEFEANKVKVGQHVQVDRRKIKVKLGPIICAFETTLVAKIEKDAETYLEKEYYNVLYELNDAVRYEREFSQAYHLYSVIYPILVKARMANGSYKLVGKANTKQELISLIEPAKQTSDFDFGIEGLEFIEDKLVQWDGARRDTLAMYKSADSSFTMFGHSRGFRNIGVAGIVGIGEYQQIIPVSGGSGIPYFLMSGEVEGVTAFTGRAVVVNSDCSRYWFVKTSNNREFAMITKSRDPVLNFLTFSDKQICLLAIEQYILSLKNGGIIAKK